MSHTEIVSRLAKLMLSVPQAVNHEICVPFRSIIFTSLSAGSAYIFKSLIIFYVVLGLFSIAFPYILMK